LHLQGTCPPFRESISWIISPFKFWTATIFFHAHLQVVYYKCANFHINPISGLGGVALTRYMDGWTGWFLYTPPNFVCRGYNEWMHMLKKLKTKSCMRLIHSLLFIFSLMICSLIKQQTAWSQGSSKYQKTKEMYSFWNFD
jgi:hypothetical protein